MLSKTVFRNLRKCKYSVNTFSVEKNAQNVFCHSSQTLVKLFLKLGLTLLIGLAENCPTSSPVQLLIQKLF